MPTINDCARCTKQCPQRQLAREQAEKRMYATNEFMNIQKDIESGKLTYVVTSHWAHNRSNGEVRCMNCNALIGVAFAEMPRRMLEHENKFCYNCGSKMIEVEERPDELES